MKKSYLVFNIKDSTEFDLKERVNLVSEIFLDRAFNSDKMLKGSAVKLNNALGYKTILDSNFLESLYWNLRSNVIISTDFNSSILMYIEINNLILNHINQIKSFFEKVYNFIYVSEIENDSLKRNDFYNELFFGELLTFNDFEYRTHSALSIEEIEFALNLIKKVTGKNVVYDRYDSFEYKNINGILYTFEWCSKLETKINGCGRTIYLN